ncbi:hypothetical protein CDAR_47731 [Caerostris darwini]|uniref:Uncharacterized protein n=1 Tax=Caerostris darwini TaxID=1538125 RepID=A0AAV4M8V8_9ARAC|nr:hypothetical protein CDAR_47731 [Caerostris darwini]
MASVLPQTGSFRRRVVPQNNADNKWSTIIIPSGLPIHQKITSLTRTISSALHLCQGMAFGEGGCQRQITPMGRGPSVFFRQILIGRRASKRSSAEMRPPGIGDRNDFMLSSIGSCRVN